VFLRALRLAGGAAAGVWLSALIAAPLVAAHASRSTHPIAWRAAALTYVAGSVVCHQRSERSFHLAGVQQPVCARCFGVYAGGAVAWLAAARRRRRGQGDARRPRRWLFLAAVPTIASVALEVAGVWEPAAMTRALLAAPAGAAVAWAIAAALGDEVNCGGARDGRRADALG
jgi:uncharacterized membrane protein